MDHFHQKFTFFILVTFVKNDPLAEHKMKLFLKPKPF